MALKSAVPRYAITLPILGSNRPAWIPAIASARRSFTSLAVWGGAGVRSQNAEDHDGGFCFLPCGLVEPPSGDRREMRRDHRPRPPLCRACPLWFAFGNVCSHSPPITSLGC